MGHARREPNAFRPAPRLLATLCFSAETDFLALARSTTTHVGGLLDLPFGRVTELRLAVDEACALFLGAAAASILSAPAEPASAGSAAPVASASAGSAVAAATACAGSAAPASAGSAASAAPASAVPSGSAASAAPASAVPAGSAASAAPASAVPAGSAAPAAPASAASAGSAGSAGSAVAAEPGPKRDGAHVGGLALVFAQIGGELRITVSGPVPACAPDLDGLGWMLLCALVGEPRWEVEADVGVLTLTEPIPVVRA